MAERVWCYGPLVNEHHLRRVLTEYLRHYNTARLSQWS